MKGRVEMIRFFNGKVLALDGNYDISENEVWVDGDKITYIGPARADSPVFEREIDLKGDLLMPGFKNAHTHSAMTFCRSLADDLPLQPWLFDMIFPLEAKLTPERVYQLTRLAILEYLSGGVTGAFDMYFYRSMGAQAAIDSGFRYTLCSLVDNASDMAKESDAINAMSPLVKMLPSIHAEYTTSVDVMREVAAFAHERRLPFFTHISETRREHEECIGRHGKTPTELLESLGLFDYGGGGYHCVWLSENDMDIFARRGLWAVTNPASNAKLASGIAPLTTFREKGMNIAIGTDGPSSNNGLDMFREMYLACVLQKLRNSDAAAQDALEVLSMACGGSAHAMSCPDCDCLAVGKQADMIVIDLQRPSMQPIINIPKNLVYSGSKDCVKMTMIAGRVLYEKGEFFIGEEPGKIYETCARIVKEMTA